MRRILIIALPVLLAGTMPASAGKIHEAIVAGDTGRVAELLRQNPELITQQDNNQTRDLPIHTAATQGQAEIARMLLDAGADVDAGDRDSSTPLGVAALFRHPETVALLLKRGADPARRDFNGACPLSFAASGGDTAIVRMILDAGADLYHVNRRGVTLLHIAASRNLEDLFDRLIALGADVNAVSAAGETPLGWAASANRMDMARKLIALGSKPGQVGENGTPPVFSAARGGQPEMIEYLIGQGAQVDETDPRGNTALTSCVWSGNEEVARTLLAHGANPSHADEQHGPILCQSIARGRLGMVRNLLEAGARPDMREPNAGRTPLHLAALLGFSDIATALIDQGADISAKDNAGHTPLQLAVRFGHASLAAALDARGAEPRGLDLRSSQLGSRDRPQNEEALIWYTGHSGWAIKTKNHLLIFDFWRDSPLPEAPALCNGRINPSEIAGEQVTVFVSHEHRDHFDPNIFTWKDQLPNVTYVLGCRPEGENTPAYEFVSGREKRKIDGMQVTTIPSTDSGVAFLVEVDGLQIYHSGDHANRLRDFAGPYRGEIDYLVAEGARPDIAFFPVSGCNFRDRVALKQGVEYALEVMKPKVFFPMHGGTGSAGHRYHEFLADCQVPAGTQALVAGECGDHFRFSGGKLQQLDVLDESRVQVTK